MAPRDQPSSSYHTRAARPALLLQNTSGPVEATPAMLQHPASHDDHISDSSGDRERRTRPFRIRSGQRASITGGPFRGLYLAIHPTIFCFQSKELENTSTTL